MSIIEIRTHAIEPFAEGREIGNSGPYLRIRGTAKGELDPNATENRGIVDLDRAAKNPRGFVEYETDLFILRPADPSLTRGVLVYDVTNRGRKMIMNLLDDAPAGADANDPRRERDFGIGFTLGQGYSLVWSGWDSSAPRANNGMAAQFPIALEDGKPMERRIRHEFHIGTRAPGKGDIVRLAYPAVSVDKHKARLAVRDREGDARTEIPPAEWEFVDNRTLRLLPLGTNFSPYRIYEIWYEATGSAVMGIGFSATRDLVSFLRYESADRDGTPSPMGDAGISHSLAFGVSQAGRFLRHFLELGMNDDGRGRRVFDGVMTHVAGAGKVFANHSFAMPGRTGTQHEDRLYPENWFPFGNAMTTDPFSAKSGAILHGRPTDPLVIEVNTSTEYWQKGASLVHTDPTGRRDVELPPNARVYMIAGTQHGGRPGVDPSPGPCANARNPHSATPALRALFAALDEWVGKGVLPPASRVPSVADGTAIEAATVRMPQVQVSLLRPAPTALARRSTGSIRRQGSTISTARWYAPLTPTATRSPGSGCRPSRSRSAPTRDGMSIGSNLASYATVMDRSFPLPPSGRSERPQATRAPRSMSAMAASTPMSRRSRRRPTYLSPSACCCRPMPPATSRLRKAATGCDFSRHASQRLPLVAASG